MDKFTNRELEIIKFALSSFWAGKDLEERMVQGGHPTSTHNHYAVSQRWNNVVLNKPNAVVPSLDCPTSQEIRDCQKKFIFGSCPNR